MERGNAVLDAGWKQVEDALHAASGGLRALVDRGRRLSSLAPRGQRNGLSVPPSSFSLEPPSDLVRRPASDVLGRTRSDAVQPHSDSHEPERPSAVERLARALLPTSGTGRPEPTSQTSDAPRAELLEGAAKLLAAAMEVGTKSASSNRSPSSGPNWRAPANDARSTNFAQAAERAGRSIDRRTATTGAQTSGRAALGPRRRLSRVPAVPTSLLPGAARRAGEEVRADRASRQRGMHAAAHDGFSLDRREWTRLVDLVTATHEGTQRLESREPTAVFG